MKFNHELNANLRNACKKTSSTDDNDRLYPLVASGDADARQKMITNNMPLVIALADSYLSLRPDYAYLHDDLIAECFLGLTEAANNLATPGKTVSNPTSYLSRSIRFHIYRAARHAFYSTHGKDMSKMMLGVRSNTMGCFETRDMIDSCCDSPLEKELLSLREVGHTFAEIARVLNTSERTLRRMFKAIRDRFDAKTKELQQ